MNKQETFNKVVEGLASQGFKQSITLGDMDKRKCMYRGDDGRKCAAGWLIPDSEYSKAMETSLAGSLAYFRNNDFDQDFVNILQEVHDYSEEPYRLKERLAKVGNDHNLTIPESLC